MLQQVYIGQATRLRVVAWNGSAMATGLSLAASTRRESDGRYWYETASHWQIDYCTNDLTEEGSGTHLVGKYSLAFTPDAVDEYTWRCVHTFSGQTLPTYWDGEIIAVGLPVYNVTLGAIQVVSELGNRVGSPIPLEMWQKEAKTFVITCLDANANPVDLSGRTLRFIVQDNNNPPGFAFKVEGAAIQVGDDDEIALVTVSEVLSVNDLADHTWLLWSVAESEVLAHGSFAIRPARKE